MRVEEFIAMVVLRRINIWPHGSICIPEHDAKVYTLIPNQFVAALNDLTAEIDYGCSFKAGKCIKMRLNGTKECCCAYCAARLGYLSNISRGHLQEYATLFNKTTGYWRKTSGCALPRPLRADTCLIHVCLSILDSLSVLDAGEIPKSLRHRIILRLVDRDNTTKAYLKYKEMLGNNESITVSQFVDYIAEHYFVDKYSGTVNWGKKGKKP